MSQCLTNKFSQFTKPVIVAVGLCRVNKPEYPLQCYMQPQDGLSFLLANTLGMTENTNLKSTAHVIMLLFYYVIIIFL